MPIHHRPPPSGLLASARQWGQANAPTREQEINQQRAMAADPNYASIAPTPSRASRIGQYLQHKLPRQAREAVQGAFYGTGAGALRIGQALIPGPQPRMAAMEQFGLDQIPEEGIGAATGLLGSFAPEFTLAGDLADLGRIPGHLGRGEWGGAGLSALAAVPIVGTPAAGLLKARRGVRAATETAGIAQEAQRVASDVLDLPSTPSVRAQAGVRERAGMGSGAAKERTRQEIRTGLLPHELVNFDKMNKRNQENFMRAYLRSPSPRELASLALQGASQRGWYEASGKTIHDVFGDDAPRFAALLASTSPKASVENNLEMAMNIWGPWVDAGRPTDPAVIARIMADATPNAKVLEAHLNNSITSLTASDELLLSPQILTEGGLLSGPKVDPFWANIMGETQRTVNDTHMARGFGILPTTVGTTARGGAMSVAMRNAAEEIFQLTGERLTGREIQEMTWGQIRAMTMRGGPRSGGGSGLGAVGAVINDAEGIARMGDETPSFATLLADPKFSDLLARLGLAAPDVAGTAARGMGPFDPALVRSEDINAVAQRIDAAREAERRQKQISDARKGLQPTWQTESGLLGPVSSRLQRSISRMPLPNPIFGLTGLLGAAAAREGIRGLPSDPYVER